MSNLKEVLCECHKNSVFLVDIIEEECYIFYRSVLMKTVPTYF